MRTFGLNSREFYEAVRAPEAEPWIVAGSLPRTPTEREREVIVERSTERSAADRNGRRSSAKTEHRRHAGVHTE